MPSTPQHFQGVSHVFMARLVLSYFSTGKAAGSEGKYQIHLFTSVMAPSWASNAPPGGGGRVDSEEISGGIRGG